VKISWIPIKEEIMTKTRAWPVRAMYMLIAAALVISLIIAAAPAQKVAADPGLSKWDKVLTPAMMTKWVLAPSFIITGFAPGATALYVIGIGYGDNNKDVGSPNVHQLLKSTDEGATWKSITDGLTTEVTAQGLGTIVSLVKVACDFGDPDFVAVALVVTQGTPDELHVLISDDGGTTFRDTGQVNAALSTAGANGVLVFSVSGEDNGVRNIVIGGTNSLATPTTPLLYRCLAIGDVGTGWVNVTLYNGWDNDGADSGAVVAFKFAPSWATDNTVLILTVNDDMDNVYLQSGTWGTVKAWNDQAGFEKAVAIFSAATTISYLKGVAGINTPSDYSGQDAAKRYLWVNVNYLGGASNTTPIGEIFRVKNKSVIAINQQVEGRPWLSGVSYFGYISEGKAIASLYGDGTGDPTTCCTGVLVYRNDSITDMDICCLPWEVSCKPPTGRLVMAAFYISPDKAYAVALGGGECEESAWSVSFDDGDTWNQLSLVNTWIDYLSDVAVSPDCNKTMLASVNLDCGCKCDSVWLKADDLPEAEEYSGQWLRTWCGNLTGDNSADFGSGRPEHGLLRLAPEETTGDTVYLVDRMSSTLYWNELETLACWKKRSATSIISHIVDLGLKDESTIYALGYDGFVAMSDDHGSAPSWSEPVDSDVTNGWTIAVLGEDILVGGQNGDVSYSADGGETFTKLKNVATSGLVTVAFDSYFNTNDTVYAAVYKNTYTGGGVYRWVIDVSTAWRDLNAQPTITELLGGSPDTGATYTLAFTGLVLDNADGNPMTSADTGGVLYASYVAYVGGTYYTGVARNLMPAAELCCLEADWDYLAVGLTPDVEGFEAMPQALKICGCLTPDSNSKLFAIDWWQWYDMKKGQEGTVWTFEDCYAKAAPALKFPADDATIESDPCYCINMEVILNWERQCDACSYDIQVALDEDFAQVLTAFNIEDIHVTKATDPTYVINRGDLDCDRTYYWRIRSADAETGQIIHSWWTEARSFTVALGPAAAVTLTAPDNGVTNVPLTDIGFTWTTVQSADEYDWVLSPNADLSAPVETKTALTDPAYTYTGPDLDNDTVYYWQVTAYRDGTVISQSGISVFTTIPEAPPPPPEDEYVTPAWVWVVIAIGAVLVIVVIVLIFRTRRV
jgi:hypothetical protein